MMIFFTDTFNWQVERAARFQNNVYNQEWGLLKPFYVKALSITQSY